MLESINLTEESLLSTHSRLVLPTGAGGRTLGFLRASIRVMAFLVARKADNALVREAVLWILLLDSFQLDWGDMLLLAVCRLMSGLSTPVADKLLFLVATVVLSHVPSVAVTAHPTVVSHVVSTH
jgi:hypothetical protein